MVKIERQTFVYYHVYLLREMKFTDTFWTTLTRVNFHLRGKSQPYELSKKSNFDIDKTFRALKMIAWSFSSHHTEKRLNADYNLPVKSNWKIFKFIKIEICF